MAYGACGLGYQIWRRRIWRAQNLPRDEVMRKAPDGASQIGSTWPVSVGLVPLHRVLTGCPRDSLYLCADASRAMQQIGRCLGYSGRGGNAFGKTARDPHRKSRRSGRRRRSAAAVARDRAQHRRRNEAQQR
jgi:hypothetical protein